MLMRRGHGRTVTAEDVDSSLTFKGFEGNPAVDFFRGFRLMFRPVVYALLTSALLAGCGGSTNPFLPDPDPGGGGGGTDPGTPSGVTGLPGTANPTASGAIWRKEATKAQNPQGQDGDGFVPNSVRYIASDDTFYVDGLAFDGDNIYHRDTGILLGSSMKVFAAKEVIYDPQTGAPIPQFSPHRALYGSTANGSMEFAIVRTGAYVEYGFGGFVYRRNGGFSLPPVNSSTGKRGPATFSGEYASIRDFSGSSGPTLEYGTGDMFIDIDFDDFNDGLGGVSGEVGNRRVYDINGNDITAQILATLPPGAAGLPVISFRVGPGMTDLNGEMHGTVGEQVFVSGSGWQPVGAGGQYYAVIGGAGGQEIVGIITLDPVADGRFSGVEVRETGGFVLTRE